MKPLFGSILFLLILLLLLGVSSAKIDRLRLKLPSDFGFGSATAAYQIEGGWLEGAKGLSIWDNLAHSNMTDDGNTGDVAADSYHKFGEDIEIMKAHGIKHFRMSISWVRILPYGRANTAISMQGVEHYLKIFQALTEAGITPYVTLYHWDLPANLFIVGEGYTDPDFPDDFAYYAETCFKHFGHLVKYWFTFNEPWCTAAIEEYEEEDKPTKPYRVTHNILLAHGKAVKAYREKYQSVQRGKIGIVINSEFYYPKNENDPKDVDAAKRCLEFQLGWYADPIFLGDYPQIMKERVRDRLPRFTEDEAKMMKGSADFFALNNYFSCIAEHRKNKVSIGGSYWDDRDSDTSYSPDWELTDSGWPIVPQGMHDLLVYIQERYLKGTEKPIFISENGVVIDEKSVADAMNDYKRIDFIGKHLKAIEQAIRDGANVKRYFYWALVDDFEWGAGFEARFGLTRIEFGESPKRTPKGSLLWYAQLIKDHQ